MHCNSTNVEAKAGGRRDGNAYEGSVFFPLTAQPEKPGVRGLVPSSALFIVLRSRTPFQFKIIGWNKVLLLLQSSVLITCSLNNGLFPY